MYRVKVYNADAGASGHVMAQRNGTSMFPREVVQKPLPPLAGRLLPRRGFSARGPEPLSCAGLGAPVSLLASLSQGADAAQSYSHSGRKLLLLNLRAQHLEVCGLSCSRIRIWCIMGSTKSVVPRRHSHSEGDPAQTKAHLLATSGFTVWQHAAPIIN